jgi:formylglycine-generating enzyme required for sulfatase activity
MDNTKLHFRLFLLMWLAVAHAGSAQTTNLNIAPAGNQVVVFWPASMTNGVLLSTTNPTSATWVTVSNGTPIVGVVVSNTSPASYFRFYQSASAPNYAATSGMALIPAGTFVMGDDLDGESDAIPIPTTVAAFYMDTNLVSYGQWQSVYNWATNNGYAFDNAGAGKAANHPAQMLDWYDAVKWTNARSQQTGLTPAYYTDAALTQVYTNGDTDAVHVNWTASGYQLPTEAEWERAARGGLIGLRFEWGNTISESQANYNGYPAGNGGFGYDFGTYTGYNTGFFTGTTPYTSPVGSFAPNIYGLFDMAGNVSEWCWDWYGTPYAGGSNPYGPPAGSDRVLRGGGWVNYAIYCRVANRNFYPPTVSFNFVGFRCVLPSGQ